MGPSIVKTFRRLQRKGMLGLAVRGSLGAQLSRVGEWIGAEGLIYNKWTYDMFHRLAVETAPAVVSSVLRRYPDVLSVVDLGAGTGAHVAEFRKQGLTCVGYEYSPIARQIAVQRLGVELRPFNLADPESFAGDGVRYDLAMSLEVGEHLPADLGDTLVEACVKSAPLVLFSAAVPGQGGQGHVNEQPRSYWIERFEDRGYRYNESETNALAGHLRQTLIRGMHLARNVMLFDG